MRLLCDAHRLLLAGVRGAGKQPGELRRSQNWIGGARSGRAVVVPPPPDRVPALLSDLERFIHDARPGLPPLVRIALVHAQFETIHPFLDGVETAASNAERSIVAIATLVAADRRRLLAAPRVGAVGLRLFELLPLMPRFTIEQVRRKLETTFPTATAAVKLLEELGIVTELTGQKKNRCFSYAAYVELLAGDT
ncbi:Fic family protein [Methylibium sp.]|uniref:Fic family protein n=1 Tax=Methylibium sp. TaxID=2067992 RepID=UPI003D14D898